MRAPWPGRVADLLLVDDNPGDVFLTREAFKDGPVEVNLNVAADGEEALEYLHQRGRFRTASRPDLILLDLNLPRRTGGEVLREIKSDPDLRDIPVVVMTTSKSERDIHEAYTLNANCYISKPIGLEEFLAVMRAVEDFWLVTATLPRRVA